jgi:hypothetical protein
MGGSKTADTIDNLMALCRECHVEFGDKKHYKELLVATHAMRMSKAGYLENIKIELCQKETPTS